MTGADKEENSSANSEASEKLPRYNHYVPEFILQAFSVAGQLKIFDKHTSKEFKSPPRRAMGERDFTNVAIGDKILSFESKFTYIENEAAPVIRKIIDSKSLTSLNPMELAILHIFVLVQHLRSKRRRLDHDLITQEIKKRWPDAPVNPAPDEISDEEFTKFTTLDFTFSNIQPLTKFLAIKHCYLMIRECNDELYISDNPLVMHNQKSYGPYGNIGLGVPHIEIYYPLSPDIALAYMCPLTMREIENAHKNSGGQLKRSFVVKLLHLLGFSKEDPAEQAARQELKRAKTFYSKIKRDRAIPMTTENVMFLNSLQISFSFRYLAARNATFDFVRKALSERPHWKDGLKVTVS